MGLENKVAIVTGGARGIGGATARLLAAKGAKVVIGDVLVPEGEQTAEEIRSSGGMAEFVRTDVTSESDQAKLVATAVEKYGGLTTVICCAGVLLGAFLQADELPPDVFRRVQDVNVFGTFLTVRSAMPALRANGGGTILMIASGAGVSGPSSSLAYGASKAGIHGFAMTLRAQVAPEGIRVHDICPGAIATEMKIQNVAEKHRRQGTADSEQLAAEQAALGDPAGVAKLLAYLASDEADFVRGTVFTR